ncbi:MAG: hypothetical protein JOY90_38425 [Bradyrhizobium sp.]|uniref:hypothetical protein n=1 Tax=Bradyrhizobium sp. TaxID=376 RepID=UPI001E118063|nr:hypothetical protein [Bradyrhizobium sp.]MBV9566281.1 hypothetical protein [Bradyrhizobium sp.]
MNVKAKSWLSGVVGATIAYVLAIQLVLSAAMSTQMVFAADDQRPTCHSLMTIIPADDRNTPVQPDDHHQACPICAFAAGTPMLSSAVASLTVRPSPIAAILSLAPVNHSALERHEPRCSQGPPLSA